MQNQCNHFDSCVSQSFDRMPLARSGIGYISGTHFGGDAVIVKQTSAAENIKGFRLLIVHMINRHSEGFDLSERCIQILVARG